MDALVIRPETHNDIEAVASVTTQAFLNATHTSHTEQLIVKALREAQALTISLVAVDKDTVVGHVALSPVTISDGAVNWYGLGPISVLPEQQGHGLGSQLMHRAIAELKKINAAGCVLLGDPNYYQRFGFKPIDGLVLEGVPPEYFQAISFVKDFPEGIVSYHPAFNIS